MVSQPPGQRPWAYRSAHLRRRTARLRSLYDSPVVVIASTARSLVFCDTPATLNVYAQLPKLPGFSSLQPTPRIFYDSDLSQAVSTCAPVCYATGEVSYLTACDESP